MTHEYALVVNNLTKRYTGFELKDISFELPKGYVMGLIGQNGAGKTTTLKSILGVVNLDGGEINLLGKGNALDENVLARIGFVLDESGCYKELNAKQNAKIIALAYGDRWDERKFQHCMKEFELPMNKKLKSFSTGMISRFKIATALSHGAELLILDEPTSGLDPVVRREMLGTLQKLVAEMGVSVLFSTHITSDLDRIADYITFIDHGRLLLSGTLEDVLSSHVLVKGPTNMLDQVTKDKIVGLQASGFGFEGLYEGRINKPGVVTQRPTLEDIMFYYSRRDV